MATRYDAIGAGYAAKRRPDPRIAAAIRAAIGDASTVVNVGAGAGSYEPEDITTYAVEPSRTMIEQRPAGAAPVVQGVAEALPFPDDAFDVALAVLTVHHWDPDGPGLAELQRVSRRQVVVTWDRRIVAERVWFAREYLPETLGADELVLTAGEIAARMRGEVRTEVLPVPRDCTDGFYAAYWARPDAYLDPDVRAAIGPIAMTDAATVDRAVRRLRDDLASGRWDARHAELRGLDQLDVGYRIVVATRDAAATTGPSRRGAGPRPTS